MIPVPEPIYDTRILSGNVKAFTEKSLTAETLLRDLANRANGHSASSVTRETFSPPTQVPVLTI
jgi:hypothetical protein